jgi:hypothetical protein
MAEANRPAEAGEIVGLFVRLTASLSLAFWRPRIEYPRRRQGEASLALIPHRLHARHQLAEEASLLRGFSSLAALGHAEGRTYARSARTAGRSAGVGMRNALAGTAATATVLPVMSKNSTE